MIICVDDNTNTSNNQKQKEAISLDMRILRILSFGVHNQSFTKI